MNLIGYLSKSKINPSSAAIIYGENALTYSEFFGYINAYKEYYKKSGVKKDSKIAILSKNNLEFVISIFSLWQLEAIPILLNTKLIKDEILELTKFSGCDFLLTEISFKDLNLSDSIKVFYYPDKKKIDAKAHLDENEVNLDDTAVIIFTSGSTGKPKGVLLSFNNLIQSALTGNQLFNHVKNDRWLASLPFYHVGGFSIIMRALLNGVTIILPENLRIGSIQNAIQKKHPTHASFVSTQLKRLIENNIKPNPELRHILLGGGFLDADLVKDALNKGWNVFKSYGSTETASFVTALTPDEFKNKMESAGKVLFPNNIMIVDENRKLLKLKTTGEVAVKGKSVAKGYINNGEETTRKFKDDIYFTGDYGFIDEECYLFIEARRNDLIVSGGENINPFEVESELLKHPLILEVSVLGLEDKEWGYIAAAVIKTSGNKTIELEELKLFLKDKLAGFKIPKRIFILDNLPKTEMGKVQKEKLKEIILERKNI